MQGKANNKYTEIFSEHVWTHSFGFYNRRAKREKKQRKKCSNINAETNNPYKQWKYGNSFNDSWNNIIINYFGYMYEYTCTSINTFINVHLSIKIITKIHERLLKNKITQTLRTTFTIQAWQKTSPIFKWTNMKIYQNFLLYTNLA